MMQKRSIFLVIFMGLVLLPAGLFANQDGSQSLHTRRFQNGAQLYELGRWQEAAIEFRRAQENARTLDEWSRSLYWVILSELAYSDYGSALRDMNDLERHAPNSSYTRDMVYHRARVYFIQGFFDEALVLFNRFIESVPDTDRVSADRRAAAFFWMGECLFIMIQYDEAEKFNFIHGLLQTIHIVQK
jgi:tetratricopeptide (TPR) repeat protein